MWKCSLTADTFTVPMSDPGQPWCHLRLHQLYLPEETVYYVTSDTHVLAFSISIPQMGNLRHQITLGCLGPPESREMYLPLQTPTLYIASAISTNCTPQSQKPLVTCRREVLKMNSFQSRKGARPVCRMSSRELLEGGVTQGTEAGDLSPTGPLFNKEYLCSGEDFPFLFCAVVPSCPCILQVHSAETHPRALHSEHIKAPASPCACVSQQCQPCHRSEVNCSRAIAQPPSMALACQPLKRALKT